MKYRIIYSNKYKKKKLVGGELSLSLLENVNIFKKNTQKLYERLIMSCWISVPWISSGSSARPLGTSDSIHSPGCTGSAGNCGFGF